MARSNAARLATATAVFGILSLNTALPVAAQTSPTITICQATGSPANPWVFTTIDARDLPEHQARGDYPAASIGDCAGARLASTPQPINTPAPAPAANQAGAVAQDQSNAAPARAEVRGTTSQQPAATLAPAATATPVTLPTLATSANSASTSSSAATSTSSTTSGTSGSSTTTANSATASDGTSATTAQVAGVQATAEPAVSTLPRGGGEPDRPMLVLMLLVVAATGLGLRRLARASH